MAKIAIIAITILLKSHKILTFVNFLSTSNLEKWSKIKKIKNTM